MTKIDLENLPYPMFVTTDEEKKMLRDAWEVLDNKTHLSYLCHALGKISVDDTAVRDLKDKIIESLIDSDGEGHTLFSYLCAKVELLEDNVDNCSPEAKEMRKIWVKKLLAYSPETN